MAIEIIEEKIILKGLVKDKGYFAKVIPYLDKPLFTEPHSRKLFECIKGYFERYGKQASIQVLDMFSSTVRKISEEEYQNLEGCISYIKNDEPIGDCQWLLDHTVEWIKKRQFYISLMDAAAEYDNGVLDATLPGKLESALGFSIDETIGLDSFDNEGKFNLYTSTETKIPFSLQALNYLTQGGCARKSLHMLLSNTTGGGKTLSKCSLAAYYALAGYNPLYVTLEVAEENIMRRIEGTLMDVEIDSIPKMGKETYVSKMRQIQEKYRGRIYVKQFPPTVCTVNHIKKLINDLWLKKRFKPDILLVDYVGLMNSTRFKTAKKYEVLASSAEELRGLCIEYDLLGWTSQQSNRNGLDDPESLGLEDISESLGISYTMDLILALVTNDTFQADHKLYFKALKNRYNAPDVGSKFFLGVDYPKMKLYDIDDGFGQHVPSYQNAVTGTASFSRQLDEVKKKQGFQDFH